MARWARSDAGVPPELCGFDPLVWGSSFESIDAWKAACLRYLAEHPDKQLPFGEYGDQLSVLREAVRLKGGWDAPAGGG